MNGVITEARDVLTQNALIHMILKKISISIVDEENCAQVNSRSDANRLTRMIPGLP
jgi:hypothetical protein